MNNWSILQENFNKDNFMLNETLFHLANGYLGIRDSLEENLTNKINSVRGTYINGFYETETIKYGEKLYGYAEYSQSIVNITDVQTIELWINNEKFSILDGEILEYKCELDLKEGCLNRLIKWISPNKKMILVEIKRMVSFINRELFIINYKVTALNFTGKITINSTVNGDVSNITSENDPRIGTVSGKHLNVIKASVEDDIISLENSTKNSNLRVITSVYHKTNKIIQREYEILENSINLKVSSDIEKGESFQIEKYSVFTDSLRYPNGIKENIDILEKILSEEIQFHFEKQKKYLECFWKNSDIIIKGNEKLQEGIRYNLYQLLQSVGKDEYTNIAAKGVSGEGYEGHYFWDTDIYILPFFMFTNKNLAKNLLMFRYRTLDAARRRANSMGHSKGALFPWRTINGDECSAFFPAGTAQYHINCDIAYSFIQYYLITNDEEFMKNYGIELIFEVARVIYDIGNYDSDGKFVINDVTGPDEYTCIVNNNYYTNVMAKYLFDFTEKAYNILQKYPKALEDIKKRLNVDTLEIKEFSEAGNKMFLPYDDKLKINPQDDSFLNKKNWDFKNVPKENYPLLLNYHPLTLYRHKVCKQADVVLANFLREEETNLDVIKNNFEYYEAITTHDSSLSTCIFSIMASRLEMKEKSYDYFLNNARLDLDNLHHNTQNGIHTASMGGSWMGIVFGFVGMRIKNEELYFNPCLPNQIEEITFIIEFKGRKLYISINHQKIEVKLVDGEELEIFINNNKILLKQGE